MKLLYYGTLTIVLATACPALAQDVVAVVSAKSRVAALSPSQLADIFLGKTSRFPDGTPAVPVDQPEESAVREKFYAQFGKSPAQVRAHWSKVIFTGRGQPPQQVSSPAEVKKMVSENPNAIGYIEPRLVDDTVKVIALR